MRKTTDVTGGIPIAIKLESVLVVKFRSFLEVFMDIQSLRKIMSKTANVTHDNKPIAAKLQSMLDIKLIFISRLSRHPKNNTFFFYLVPTLIW
jgi:hypothetical protein